MFGSVRRGLMQRSLAAYYKAAEMMKHPRAALNSQAVEEARGVEVRAGIRVAHRARPTAPLKPTLGEYLMPVDDDMTRATDGSIRSVDEYLVVLEEHKRLELA